MRKITRYCVIALAALGLSVNLVGCSNNSHHSDSIKISEVDRLHSKKSVTKNSKHSTRIPKTKTTNDPQSTSSDSQTAQASSKAAVVTDVNQLPTARSATVISTNQGKKITEPTTQSAVITAAQFRQRLVK